MRYIIVRSDKAGVFAGSLKWSDGNTIELSNARRLWYWAGAASLSQLAIQGVSEPENCKFPEAVSIIRIFEVVEILDVTPEARASIEAVPVWDGRVKGPDFGNGIGCGDAPGYGNEGVQ